MSPSIDYEPSLEASAIELCSRRIKGLSLAAAATCLVTSAVIWCHLSANETEANHAKFGGRGKSAIMLRCYSWLLNRTWLGSWILVRKFGVEISKGIRDKGYGDSLEYLSHLKYKEYFLLRKSLSWILFLYNITFEFWTRMNCRRCKEETGHAKGGLTTSELGQNQGFVDMGHRNWGQGLYILPWKNSGDTVSCETCLKFNHLTECFNAPIPFNYCAYMV